MDCCRWEKTKTIDHLAQIKLKDESKSKIGIDGLAVLNSDKVNSQGKGYDMLWTFNMSADGSNFNNGSPVTVARYNDLVSRGFEVKDIELGNSLSLLIAVKIYLSNVYR